jgi:ABC-type glycerol-3-phosphate transport system substrate-binding protein
MRSLPKHFWVIVGVLLLAACGGAPADNGATAPDTSSSDSAPQTDDAVTLGIALVDYTDEHKTWLEQEIIPAFQQSHPNVVVEPVYLNWSTLNETYAGYFAADDGPDILNLGSEFAPEYGDRLLPLNSYMQSWPDLEQYLPATLEATTWQGELRGLPWLVMPRTYMCRSDLLEEDGINTVPQTFDEAIDQAAATTIIKDSKLERAGIWTIGADLQDWQEYIQFIWAAGGTLYTADGAPAFDSDQSKRALQFMYDRRRAVLPNETTAMLGEAQGSRLATGEVACMWSNAWGAPPLDDAVWSDIVIAPSPYPEGGQPVVQIFTDWLGVPQYTENPDLAVEFLQLLGSQENQAKYNAIFGSFSPRKDATIENPVMQKQAEMMAEYGRTFADVRSAAKLSEILQAELPLYFQDIQDLDTTVQNIQDRYTQALKDDGKL